MASEIKVDTIVNAGGDNDTGIDLATNDQILLKVANATRLTMNATGQTTIVGEGGTTTTSVQQGLAKCWIDYDTASFGTNDSFNVTSISDEGTGLGQTNISNDMANINYSMTQGCRGGAANGTKIFQNGAKAVGSFQIYTVDRDGGAFDINNTMATVHGDLA